MSILVTRCLKRSELVKELYERVTENWQIEHKGAIFASDVEELCGECLELTELCKHVWTTLRGNLEKIRNTQKVGLAFEEALAKSLDVLKGVLELCETADKKNYQIKGHERVMNELSELKELSEAFAKDWPFFRKDMMDAARSAYLRGDYRTAEDLLNDPQDHC